MRQSKSLSIGQSALANQRQKYLIYFEQYPQRLLMLSCLNEGSYVKYWDL